MKVVISLELIPHAYPWLTKLVLRCGGVDADWDVQLLKHCCRLALEVCQTLLVDIGGFGVALEADARLVAEDDYVIALESSQPSSEYKEPKQVSCLTRRHGASVTCAEQRRSTTSSHSHLSQIHCQRKWKLMSNPAELSALFHISMSL